MFHSINVPDRILYLPTFPFALVIWFLRHQFRYFVNLRTSFDILVLYVEWR